MRTIPFDFGSEHGRCLAGRIALPEGEAAGSAIFAHCFTCASDSLAAVRISRALADRKLGVLRFDFTGLGRSEGEFGRHGLSGDVSDILAAARAMDETGMPVRLLVGHSLGGAAILAAGASLASVRALATIAAPFRADHILQHLGAAVEEIEQHGKARVELGGRPFSISRSFVEDVRRHRPDMSIAELHRPLLVMHAPGDTIVPIGNAEQIYAAAGQHRSFVSLDRADHLLTSQRHATYAAEVIASWASIYLDPDATPR